MPRASTTSDAFNAVAEPRRRDILSFLVSQERAVNDIVATLNLREGRQMFYRTNPDAIRPLHEWTGTFERYWSHQLARVKERAEAREKPK